MNWPLVTCIVTTYKHERWLARTIESVLLQDYPHERLQIIVADDGSPDGTPAIVEQYGTQVTYLRQPNSGVIDLVNNALELVEGEFISFVDGDDEWLPHKIMSEVEIMQARPEVGLLYGDMELIDGDNALIASSYNEQNRLVPQRGTIFGPLLKRNFINAPTNMFRTSLKPYFHPIPAHIPWPDWWMALRAAQHAEADFVPFTIARYRQHAGNMFHAASGEKAARNTLKDAEMRRWLLLNLDTRSVEPGDLVAAYNNFASFAERSACLLNQTITSLIAVTPDDERLSHAAVQAARRAESDGDQANTIRHLVRALVHNPFAPQTRQHLETVVRSVTFAPQPPRCGSHEGAMLLDGKRSVGFLHIPVWDAPDSAWQDVLAGYIAAFDAEDDVTLVLALDGRQAVTAAVAAERIRSAMAKHQGDPELLPDILLVPEPVDDRKSWRLYAAADWLIPSTVGQRALATHLGTRMLCKPTVDRWRLAAQISRRAA